MVGTSNADRQSFHKRESQTHRTRSAQRRRSLWPRLERCRTKTWWRRARISAYRTARARKPGRLPDATLYMQRFNVCELFGRDSRFPQIVGFRKFPKKFPPPRQGRFGSFFRWLPLLPELVMSIPVLEISGHRIPYGHRVVARAVLGGLHHEYRLEEITA